MNEKSKTVCFSGHREINDYEPKENIEKRLEAAVRKCILNGAEQFIAGGAIGFDTIAAEIVIRLRGEFPNIRLVLALPCPPECQMCNTWTAQQKNEYQEILSRADEVRVLSDKYKSGCMFARNRYMVNNSGTLIYYLRSDKGGTKYTVDYAKRKSIELVGV